MQPLPIHGFVLAGGRSTRMGQDKALMSFRGQPMIALAVEKLKMFCAEVSIAGNREDLQGYAEVVPEARMGEGPAAGVEAGLQVAKQPWAMFLPVDVPLVPAEILRQWAAEVLLRDDVQVSHLFVGVPQPAFCMLRRECLARFSAALEAGDRRLLTLFQAAAGESGVHWVHEVSGPSAGRWFMNVNTPEEMAAALD